MFGRRLMYPGSLALIQTAMGKLNFLFKIVVHPILSTVCAVSVYTCISVAKYSTFILESSQYDHSIDHRQYA